MSAGTRLAGSPEPMHRWQGARGITLAADSWGVPTAPLVLLQHGGGQTRHAWKRVGKVLGEAGYYAVSFDARGHGDSDWAADGVYTQDSMVEDLVFLTQHLQSRNPALIGASMGGGVSLVAIGEGYIDASALVLVDIAPQIEPAGAAEILGFMSSRPEGFDSLREVADAISAYQPHRHRPSDLSGLSKNVRLAPNGKYHWHWDPQIVKPDREFQKRYDRLCECSRALTVPTLLVRGGISNVLSEAGAQHFRELCPHSEYVSIEGAAHMIAGDRNDIFGAAVVDFLKRAVRPMSASHAARSRPPRSPDSSADIVDLP